MVSEKEKGDLVMKLLDDVLSMDPETNSRILAGLDAGQASWAHVPTGDLQISAGLLQPNMCHLNADLVSEITGGECVRGWIVFPKALILHSVNRIDGNLVCFTPHQAGGSFQFIPDNRISVNWDGDVGHVMMSINDRPELQPAHSRAFTNLGEAVEIAEKFLSEIRSGKHPEDFADEVFSELMGEVSPVEIKGASSSATYLVDKSFVQK